jgi:hypothetical protein
LLLLLRRLGLLRLRLRRGVLRLRVLRRLGVLAIRLLSHCRGLPGGQFGFLRRLHRLLRRLHRFTGFLRSLLILRLLVAFRLSRGLLRRRLRLLRGLRSLRIPRPRRLSAALCAAPPSASGRYCSGLHGLPAASLSDSRATRP